MIDPMKLVEIWATYMRKPAPRPVTRREPDYRSAACREERGLSQRIARLEIERDERRCDVGRQFGDW